MTDIAFTIWLIGLSIIATIDLLEALPRKYDDTIAWITIGKSAAWVLVRVFWPIIAVLVVLVLAALWLVSRR